MRSGLGERRVAVAVEGQERILGQLLAKGCSDLDLVGHGHYHSLRCPHCDHAHIRHLAYGEDEDCSCCTYDGHGPPEPDVEEPLEASHKLGEVEESTDALDYPSGSIEALDGEDDDVYGEWGISYEAWLGTWRTLPNSRTKMTWTPSQIPDLREHACLARVVLKHIGGGCFGVQKPAYEHYGAGKGHCQRGVLPA